MPVAQISRYVCFSLLLIFMSGESVRAQDEVQKLLQVVSFKPVGGENAFFWQTEEMKKPDKQPQVRVSSNTLLDPVKYKGPRKLTLMLYTGESGYQPVAQVALPELGKRAIVVLLPSATESKLPYRAIAMNGDTDKFKPGTRRLLNLSNTLIRGEMGAKPFRRGDSKNIRFVCKPQKIVEVPVLNPKAKVLASQPAVLEYLSSKKKWNMLSSTRWFHTPTQRHLIFVYYDGARKNLILRGVSDTVAADTRDIAANRMSKEKEDPEARKARIDQKKQGPASNPRYR